MARTARSASGGTKSKRKKGMYNGEADTSGYVRGLGRGTTRRRCCVSWTKQEGDAGRGRTREAKAGGERKRRRRYRRGGSCATVEKGG